MKNPFQNFLTFFSIIARLKPIFENIPTFLQDNIGEIFLFYFYFIERLPMSAEIKLPTLTWQSSIKQLQGEKEHGRSLIRYNTFHFGNIDGHNYLTKKKKTSKR